MNMKYLITALIVALLSLSTVGAVDIDAVNDATLKEFGGTLTFRA